MTMSLAELEAEVLRLRKMVEEGSKANDYLEIWQLMSMYSHLYHVFKRCEVPNLFAQKTPGVEVEIEDSGVYEGIEGVRTVFCGILADESHKIPGFLGIHMTCNPVIEMNKGRTEGKGLWHSHGSVTLNMNGQLTSFWCQGKYDMTFVKEDGRWKILKMFYRLTYMTPFEKGWVEEPQGASISAAHAKFPPDRPSTYHMPYHRHRINVFQPPPPKPYEE